MQINTAFCFPGLFGMIPFLLENFHRIPVFLFLWQVGATLQYQYFFSRTFQLMQQCSAACTRTDNDNVVLFHVIIYDV